MLQLSRAEIIYCWHEALTSALSVEGLCVMTLLSHTEMNTV